MSAESLSWLLLAFAPIDWLITWFVMTKARRLGETSLTFTAGIFVASSLVVTVGALLGFAYLNEMAVPREVYTITISASFLIPAAIPPLWLIAFAFGRFR